MFLQNFSRILIINVFNTCLAMCVYVKTKIMLEKKKRFVFSNLLSRVIIFIELARVVYVSHFKNVTLFLVREHSERRCFLVFAVHCGIFQGANVPVLWKDFVIETALKMADSLISVLTAEQGSWLRRTLNLFSFETA